MADNAEAPERHAASDSSSINVLLETDEQTNVAAAADLTPSGPNSQSQDTTGAAGGRDPRVSDDLHRVAGVLHDMAIAANEAPPTAVAIQQPVSPGIPPVAFGAGGTL